MQSGLQVGITRFTRSSDKAAEDKFARKSRKPVQGTSQLFSLLSTDSTSQPEQYQPPARRVGNQLSAIFSRPQPRGSAAVNENDSNNNQVTAQQPHLQPQPTPQAHNVGYQRSSRQQPAPDTCTDEIHRVTQQPGTKRSAPCQQAMPKTRIPITSLDELNTSTVQQPAVQPHCQLKQSSPQAAVQECPICGVLVPAQQLQQHVNLELQELEELEKQPLAQPLLPDKQQNQQLPPCTAEQMQMSQPTALKPQQQAQMQQPLQPVQLPPLAAHRQDFKQFLQHKERIEWWQQQNSAQHSVAHADQRVIGVHLHPKVPSQGCQKRQHIHYPLSSNKQYMHQWPKQLQSIATHTGRQQVQQEPCKLHPLHQSAYQQPASAPHQQQPVQEVPPRLPPLVGHNQRHQQQQARSRRKRARYGSNSSSLPSCVTSLQMAPSSSRASGGIEASPGMLDSFDHWGDTRENWLDDHMIGLEGAPQSAGECWEGLGRCAVGGSTLR